MRRPLRFGAGFPISRAMALVLCLAVALAVGGCAVQPHMLPPAMQKTIDRHITEYPSGFELKPYIVGLDSPTGFCIDPEGNMLIAEGGYNGVDPRIFGIRPDGTRFTIYPVQTRVPIFHPGFRIYGPVGGIAVDGGRIFVSHRDHDDMGVITSFGYDGSHQTVIAGLPAQGDGGVTDVAVSPVSGRLYFGVGAATNSGVVGLDNWAEGWVREHPDACDIPYGPIDLLGYRYTTAKPESSLFSPNSVVTVPFQPFGVSDVIQIPGIRDQFPVVKPTGAIMSVSPDGGDVRLEAWGVHDPRGLAIDGFDRVYFTDRGMELRGTRPIDQDPDGLFQLKVPGAWFGWPDYSRSLESVGMKKFQPPDSMVIPTGYPNVRQVIDHEASKLSPPDRSFLSAQLRWQSGVSKMTFVPPTGPFHRPPFEGQLIVAEWGDRTPFSTAGQEPPSPRPGFRVVLVDPNLGEVKDLVYNTAGGPASSLTDGQDQALERPIDVKFGADGKLYILDFGRAGLQNGRIEPTVDTGKIFVCVPVASAAGTSGH